MAEKIFNCEEVTLERFLSLRLLKRSREILILHRSEDHVINRVVGHAPNNRSIRVIILDSSARSKCTLVLTRQYMRSSIPLSVRTRANVAWDTHLCWYINVNLLFFYSIRIWEANIYTYILRGSRLGSCHVFIQPAHKFSWWGSSVWQELSSLLHTRTGRGWYWSREALRCKFLELVVVENVLCYFWWKIDLHSKMSYVLCNGIRFPTLAYCWSLPFYEILNYINFIPTGSMIKYK